jgi:hypothetical protein
MSPDAGVVDLTGQQLRQLLPDFLADAIGPRSLSHYRRYST